MTKRGERELIQRRYDALHLSRNTAARHGKIVCGGVDGWYKVTVLDAAGADGRQQAGYGAIESTVLSNRCFFPSRSLVNLVSVTRL